MIMGSTYYAYLTLLLWPKFIVEGTAGLNVFARCALLIDEVDELSVKASENQDKLKLLKCIEVEEQVGSY